ncbi:MAG: hypothetical protein ACR2FU_04230 [Streptosporangiaceae bacterium]
MTRQAGWRWAAVAAGVAVLAALPSAIAAFPVAGSAISAPALRARIMASARLPYQGYAESTAGLALPDLPALQSVVHLLDGTTDQYAWYRSPGHWRSEQLTAAGEDDVYQVGPATYQWIYAYNLFSRTTGPQPVRLPRAPDLLPPELGRRLLGLATAADHISRLPSARVAGVAAAGLRLTVAGKATTVSAVDIWADPADGLPVKVQVFARGAVQPILTTSFLQLNQSRPAEAVVTPHPAPGVTIADSRPAVLRGVLGTDGDGDGDTTPFPALLAGLRRNTTPAGLFGLAPYGSGFSQIIMAPLPGRAGAAAVNAATAVSAVAVPVGPASGVLVRTPLLTVLLVVARFRHRTFLLTGAVTPALLERAGADMLASLAAGPR